MILDDLKRLEEDSRSRGIPIIGSVKGAWLLAKVKELKPSRILELGTANGYSGIILGSESGSLVTIEQDMGIANEAKENFAKFKINANVIIGDGVEEIGKLENDSFDLVFIDFAKRKYIEVLEDAIRVCKEGGFIIADNITMHGCADFKDAVLHDVRLETEIVNVGDGLSLSWKVD